MTGDLTMLHAMTGPEFLDAFADQSDAAGLHVNADIIRSRAREWQADQRTIERLRTELQQAHDRLDRIRTEALAA